MKKYGFILISLLLTSIIYGQEKSGKITYGIKINAEAKNKMLDSLEGKGSPIKNRMKKFFVGLEKSMPHVHYEMEFNAHQSLFQVQKSMPNDNGIDIGNVAGTTSSNGLFYTDLTNNTTLWQRPAYGNVYRVKSPADSLQWNIQDQTKVVKGYKCQKATHVFFVSSHRMVTTAWFCPDLPFQFGPKGITGLPGLILELNYVGNFTFYAKKIKLDEKPITIKKPKKGKVITAEEWDAMIRRYNPYSD